MTLRQKFASAAFAVGAVCTGVAGTTVIDSIVRRPTHAEFFAAQTCEQDSAGGRACTEFGNNARSVVQRNEVKLLNGAAAMFLGIGSLGIGVCVWEPKKPMATSPS